jgi:predicted permease
MFTLRKLVRRARALLGRRALDRELDEELRGHIEMQVAQLSAEGMDPAEARRRALLDFGGLERFREEARDARGVRPLQDFARDLRLGARALRRRPGFTAVVVLTLGVGVGGGAAIFGAVDGILLTPLPYPEPDRLLTLWQHDRKAGPARKEVTPADFLDWRERSTSFAPLTAMEPFGLDWQSAAGPVYLPTWLVYEGFFEAFGTQPLLGRTFRPEEHAPGRGDVVVLGHGVWRSRFGGAPEVVGRVLPLDGRPHLVLGVMPQGFAMPSDDVVWAPKVPAGWERTSRSSHFYPVFGRLRPGVSAAQAQAELNAIAAQIARDHPQSGAEWGVTAVPLPEQVVGGVRRALLLLLGAVGFLLAVVTANVASLQLARAAGRDREFAVRGALGASPGRVARQLLAENLLLAAGGAGLGFALAQLSLRAARAWAPLHLPRATELKADGEVLLFAAAVSLVTALATGIPPLLAARRARLQASLAQGGRAATRSRRLARTQSTLVAVQLCLSLVLLIAAGLLVRSFASVLSQPRGFRTDGVAVLIVQSWGYYPQPADRAAFVREVTERLARQPQVHAAGMTSAIPLLETIGAEQAPVTIVGAPALPAGESPPLVQFTVATAGLFRALGIPLLRGRLFEERDHDKALPVALVSESFARAHWPHQDPIGQRLALGGSARGRQPAPVPREVIGVVGDVRRYALHESARPSVYLPHSQLPTGANAFVVWGEGRTSDLMRQVRQVVWQVNPTVPVYREASMGELVGASVRDRRFLLALLGGFAALALGLATVGVFALMSYVTMERTREFGVRMALGAARGQVVVLVLKQGLGLAAVGVGLGLAGAVGVTRLLSGSLHGVTPLDPATFAGGAGLLLATALLASWYPAWRAARVDPAGALKDE